MSATIDYLKSPELVVRIQQFFGVEYLNPPFGSPRKGVPASPNKIQNGHRSAAKSTQGPKEKAPEQASYRIRNKWWYYLFLIGTELGDEIFYASFIPFWFWNIDSAVGRRVIFLWSIVMYIGQSCKDIVRWQRPGPPVIRLQNKWALEYGMPSTHAMVAVSIPFSVLIFTLQRYQYPALIGLIAATAWCSVICVSRLYLGMHSVLVYESAKPFMFFIVYFEQRSINTRYSRHCFIWITVLIFLACSFGPGKDIIAGILLTIFLMIFLIPLVDFLDYYIVTHLYSPLFVLFISIMLIVCHPKSDKWTPTRGDSTMMVSVTVGLQIGAWLNYQVGDMVPTSLKPPYQIIWPTYQMFGMLLLRTVLGLCCIVATRAVAKSISYAFVCAILGKRPSEIRKSESSLENRNKNVVDLCYKYFTYGMIGFNTQYLLPNAFKLVSLGRPDFYTEI